MAQTLPWKTPSNFEEVEKRGILAGVESNGNKVFVGRTYDRDGNFIPAKIIPSYKNAYYAFNDAEVASDQVEYLEDEVDFHWVKSEGEIVSDAAEVNGFYIGRALYNGNIVVGRIDPKTKQLVGSQGGATFSLPKFDILIHKAKGVVYEAIQKARNVSNVTTEKHESSFTRIGSKISEEKFTRIGSGATEDTTIELKDYLSVVKKLRSLETEKLSYLKDKQSYDQRLEFEQRKVFELSNQLKKFKIDNARFSKERESFEEKFSSEQRRFTNLEAKVQEYGLNNSFLLKRVNALEEAIRYEKLLTESLTEKFSSTQTYSSSLTTKLTDFESTIKSQQQRIFELESDIMISSSSSESLQKRVSDYDETIKYLRLQLETYIKKLEISGADNDFLIQKLSLLTKTLRNYQNQIECLSDKLQSAKTVIATSHAELSRANAQVSKYQAALSSCYTLNGELMTKVSGMSALAQHGVGVECSLNLINYSSDLNFKSSSYSRTSSLLEMTGSDTFLGYAADEEPLGTPYGVTEPEVQKIQAFGVQPVFVNGGAESESAI